MADNFKKFTPTTKTEDKFSRVKIPLYPLGYAPVCNTWHETLHVTIGMLTTWINMLEAICLLWSQRVLTQRMYFSLAQYSADRLRKNETGGGQIFSQADISVLTS